MKTICYVDGYNLYFGCLKYTPHKWLDIKKLFERIIRDQNPAAQIECIRFFTAPIISKMATHGQAAQASQMTYHRALECLYPDTIEIINGYYSKQKARAMLYLEPPDKTQRVDVWKLEEKQTDVNIALAAYRDVLKNRADQIVFVSNDTDLEPALRAIREDFGSNISIGVVLPIKEVSSSVKARPGNARLSQFADWTRRHIKNNELVSSQLPDLIRTNKQPIRKPSYW